MFHAITPAQRLTREILRSSDHSQRFLHQIRPLLFSRFSHGFFSSNFHKFFIEVLDTISKPLLIGFEYMLDFFFAKKCVELPLVITRPSSLLYCFQSLLLTRRNQLVGCLLPRVQTTSPCRLKKESSCPNRPISTPHLALKL